MSTGATAAAREPYDQPRTNRWLKYVGEEGGTSSANSIPIERPTTETLQSLDLARVEKLVGQLEARSLALVKYRYVEPPQRTRPPSNHIVIISALVAVWLSTLALAVAFVFLSDHVQQKASGQGSLSGKRIISPLRPEQKLTIPVGQLLKSLAPSLRGLKRLEAAGELSKHPKQIQGPTTPIPQPPTSSLIGSPDAATASITSPVEPSSSDPSVIRQIRPCDMAQPHQAVDGTVDYWVLPRGPDGNSATKVISVGKASNGVVVSDLEDGKYYTVTPAGAWHRIPIPSS